MTMTLIVRWGRSSQTLWIFLLTKVKEPTLKPQYPNTTRRHTVHSLAHINTFETFRQPTSGPSRHESPPKRRVPSKATGICKGITVDDEEGHVSMEDDDGRIDEDTVV